MQLGFVAEEEEKQNLFGQAAKDYTEAADTYYKDDEKHAYFLKIALEAHWWRGDPLKTTLPLCARIRKAVPEMKKIWEIYVDKMEGEYKMVLDYETECRKDISEGKMTLDGVMRPVYMVSGVMYSQRVGLIENMLAGRYYQCSFDYPRAFEKICSLNIYRKNPTMTDLMDTLV